MNNGFIKLHRKFLTWEWYQDTNTKILFLHLLLKANYKDNQWQGITIKRGDVVIGLMSLSEELNLSVQQIRTSLKKLKSSQKITSKSTNKFTVVTIVNYDKYQDAEIEITNGTTNEQQTDNKRITTLKERKEYKEDKNKEKIYKKEKYFDDVELNDLFIEFLELRKKLKAVNSERAVNTLLNILNDYDLPTKKEMINNSIVNSWKSIYPKKEDIKKLDQQLPKWFNEDLKKEEITDEEHIKRRNEFISEIKK